MENTAQLNRAILGTGRLMIMMITLLPTRMAGPKSFDPSLLWPSHSAASETGAPTRQGLVPSPDLLPMP